MDIHPELMAEEIRRFMEGTMAEKYHIEKNVGHAEADLAMTEVFSGLSAGQIADRMEAFLDSILPAGKPILLISPPILQYGEWVMDDDRCIDLPVPVVCRDRKHRHTKN